MSTSELRRRQASRTRSSLMDASLQMFLAHGFGNVTVEQVAGQAEVSARTAYRYFSTKEGLALARLADLDERFLELVESRPSVELPIDTLRFALRGAWDWLESAGLAESYLLLQDLVDGNPDLRAANLRRGFEQQRFLVEAIARHDVFAREGDLYPRLVVAAFSGAASVAVEQWRAAPSGIDDLKAALDRSVEALLPALKLAAEPNH